MNAIAPNLTAERSRRRPRDGERRLGHARRRAGGDRPGHRKRATEIQAANELDVAAATGRQTAAIIDRLTLTPDRIAGLAEGVRAVIALPDRSAPCSAGSSAITGS